MKSVIKHIHITGASGSGTTTLGAALSETFSYRQIDTDDIFWKTKYTEIQHHDIRRDLLEKTADETSSWILSGSIGNWGKTVIPLFDIVVFLSIPSEIRMKRLEKREFERYGKDILPGGSRYKSYREFMDWAGQYETGGLNIRSRTSHEEWLKQLKCPVIRIEGDTTTEERVKMLLSSTQHLQSL